MKLTILGSGTSVPHPERAASADWLETNKGVLLLDMGSDTAHRMAQERLDEQSRLDQTQTLKFFPASMPHFLHSHTAESLVLRLKDEDSKLFVYTSDTGFSEDLIPFAKTAEHTRGPR